jgi:hypothetical protein
MPLNSDSTSIKASGVECCFIIQGSSATAQEMAETVREANAGKSTEG